MTIRVILVDDHLLIRRGLRDTLAETPDIRVVGEAGDYGELRVLLRQQACDVLLLDVNLPGRSGIDVLQSLSMEGEAVRSVVLSQHAEDQYGIRAFKAGAMAYLNKTAAPEVIVAAVRTAASGRKYITPELAQVLAESVANGSTGSHEQLSDREMQTLVLIARGHKLSDIAERLTLSPKTVSVYRARVLEKLGLSSNAELATYAMRNRLID